MRITGCLPLLIAALVLLLPPSVVEAQRVEAPATLRYQLPATSAAAAPGATPVSAVRPSPQAPLHMESQGAPQAAPRRAMDPAGLRASLLQSPTVAVLASALLPGAGQWLQGKRRWVPYLAVEVWSWVRWREHRGDARALAREYRDVAWRVARRVGVGERRDTVFEYYEALADDLVRASGAFDASPLEPGVQPEQEPGTFNGELWLLARKLFFGGGDYGPGTAPYEAALEYYLARAIPDSYAWAWAGSELEQQVYAGLIEQSDEAYRKGSRIMAVILANHIASAVDALITARLSALSGSQVELQTGLSPDGPDGPVRFDAQMRIHF